jgi:hypothetical protein
MSIKAGIVVDHFLDFAEAAVLKLEARTKL